jgi:16S rRNA (cytosine967-C5)-methyltransferase
MVLASAEEVLREILRFSAPADTTLSRYFKDHPRLGGRERGAIAECVYAVLRNKAFFTDFAESGSGPAMRRLVLLGMADAMGLDSLPGLTDEETAWLQRAGAIDRKLLHKSMRSNMPKWLYEKLVAQFGEEEALALADALNTPAPLDLRVNAIKANRDDVIAELAQAPIAADPTPFAPLGLRVHKKPALQNCRCLKAVRSKCRTRAARSCPRSWAPSAAKWWSTFAPAPAAKRWRSARRCAIPVACTRSTCRKNAWPS